MKHGLGLGSGSGKLYVGFIQCHKQLAWLGMYDNFGDCLFADLPYCGNSMAEGSLEVKLPTIWTDGKAEVRRVREEKPRSEKIREQKE